VLRTTSAGGFAAGDPHEVDYDAAAIDRTTIPNFDPVLDHVADRHYNLPLLYSNGDSHLDVDDSRIDEAVGDTAAVGRI